MGPDLPGGGKGADGMERKKSGLLLPVMAAALLLLLSGCFFRSPDDLYRLPERSAGYDNLKRAIDAAELSLAQEYGVSVEAAVINAGENTANIQLQDMDGDGVRETAVKFFRVPGVEKAMKIYFFTNVGEDEYQVSAVVEGDGSAIYAVDYVDLNGNGYKEIVVSWQMSTGVYLLGAYSMDDHAVVQHTQDGEQTGNVPAPPRREELLAIELMTTSYTNYTLMDIDQDNRTEIAVVRVDPAGTSSMVQMYGWRDGTFGNTDSAPISAGITTLGRVRANYLAGELPVPALYLTSTLANGQVATDIVAYQNGVLTNLTLDGETGVSREVRQGMGQIDLSDIDGDRVLEIPSPIKLPVYGDAAGTDFWLMEWCQYDGNGERSLVCTTYHNISDEWYLVIPESWRDKITIARNDRTIGQRTVNFSLWNGPDTEPTRFLAISKLSGTNRFTWASSPSRFILQENSDSSIIYTAMFYDGWDCGLDDAELRELFHVIQNRGWMD